MKTCRVCGDTKPLDGFYKRPSAADGHRNECCECVKAARQRRYDANPEKHREEAKASYRKHRPARQATKAKWYASHRDELAEKQRQYNAANPDKLAAYREANKERIKKARRAYNEREREKIAEYSKRYRLENPEKIQAWKEANVAKIREYTRRYRLRKLAQFVETVDDAVLWERDAGLCGICGSACDPADYHVDHIVPVSKGGEHSYANTQLAHPLCNWRKSDRLAA